MSLTASKILSESILLDTQMVRNPKCTIGTCGCLEPYSPAYEYYSADDDCICENAYNSDFSESDMCNCFEKRVPKYRRIKDIPNETIKQILKKNESTYDDIMKKVCNEKGLNFYQEAKENAKKTSHIRDYQLLHDIFCDLSEEDLKKVNFKELLQMIYMKSVKNNPPEIYSNLLKQFSYDIIIKPLKDFQESDVNYFDNFFKEMSDHLFLLKRNSEDELEYIETEDKRLNILITYYQKYLKGSSESKIVCSKKPAHIQILDFLLSIKYDFKKVLEEEIIASYKCGGNPTMFYLHSCVHKNDEKRLSRSASDKGVSLLYMHTGTNEILISPELFYRFINEGYVIYEEDKIPDVSSKLSKDAKKFLGVFNNILFRYEHDSSMIDVFEYFVNHAFVSYHDCKYLSKKMDELWKTNMKKREHQKRLSSILTKRINDINNNF